MKPSFSSLRLRCLFLGLMLAGAGRALAQWDGEEEPRWLRLSRPSASLGMETEGLMEEVSLPGASSTHEYLSLTPLVGLGLSGSVYHSALMQFDLSGEGGLGWTTDTVKSTGFELTRHESRELLRYLVQAHFLPRKPYNATFFAAQDHTYNNYDFFNTATVDSDRLGGRLAWTTAAFSLNADTGNRSERSSGLNGTTDIEETYFNFNGTHKRKKGRTTLTYRFNEFQNTVNSGSASSSMNNSVALSDSETFGRRDQVTATTGVSYGQFDYSSRRTEAISANENVTINHHPKLDSYYSLYYTRNSLDPLTTSVLQGVGGLRHRLYDSLTSSLDVHGSRDESSGLGAAASDARYGVGIHEDYTKRLGKWGRLTLGAGIVADHQEHESPGGVLASLNESHQLYLLTSTNYTPAFLRHPRVVLDTVVVRGPNGLPVQQHLDYELIQSGDLIEVRLAQGSVALHDGDTVQVNYYYEGDTSGAYDSLNENAQFRLDLFNLVGIYARANWLNNNAPPDVLVEEFTDWVAGVDVSWRWLRAGAEYQDFDSNFSKYQALRFFETANFEVGDSSTLGFQLNQLFNRYPAGRRDTQYQFITRFNTRLAASLQWYVEGGYSLLDIAGTSQDLGAARTGLSYVRGNLSAQAGYQYNYQLTQLGTAAEQRDRNYFFIHLKRTF